MSVELDLQGAAVATGRSILRACGRIAGGSDEIFYYDD
jgi:hypothetical protein